MPIQYINELLGLPELQLHSVVSIHETEVHLEASPVAYKQACPLCRSEEAVKRDGRNTPRKIRHVSIFGKKCFLHIPSLRLACSRCNIGLFGLIRVLAPRNNTVVLFACRP
ncbi:transposase family protein [Paenibacillus sp. FSL L8-0340]|uniref:transposase family protein n=1 Tax=Paenibacillus sp. FSL L8-0340 TaxID=2954685 RepID=UPI003158139D